MLPCKIFLRPVNSSMQDAQGQFSRRYHEGYELKCPSFQVTSVWVGLTLLTRVGVMYCKNLLSPLAAVSYSMRNWGRTTIIVSRGAGARFFWLPLHHLLDCYPRLKLLYSRIGGSILRRRDVVMETDPGGSYSVGQTGLAAYLATQRDRSLQNVLCFCVVPAQYRNRP